MPSGSTRVAAVIGDPIAHSRSPLIHNAAFRALGLDWVYVAFHVPAGDVGRALDGMRAFGLGGLSVTMPHKDDVALAVDELTDGAKALGAVNCVERRGDTLIGHNTDGAGFLAAVRDAGCDPAGKRCAVLGAGGAARAVIHALGQAGALEVVVINRTAARAASAVALGRLGGSAASVGEPGDVAGVDIVVNATSIGMGASAERGELPCSLDDLTAAQVVVDLVVHPVETPLLRGAAERGATVVDGLGMLVHQGAIAFEIWTGVPAPIDVMARAVRSQPS